MKQGFLVAGNDGTDDKKVWVCEDLNIPENDNPEEVLLKPTAA